MCIFFSKYTSVVLLKDKKCIKITSSFQKILNETNRKSNKILKDKGSKFYNKSMRLWFHDNDIKIYVTHIEGKSVVA